MFRKGFTLAETLITLVIIGVVAALTVPNLIVRHQKEETVTKLKKVYSTLQQAINKSTSENGSADTWNNWESSEYIVKNYFAPYLNYKTIYPNRTNYGMVICSKVLNWKYPHKWKNGNGITSPMVVEISSLELIDGTCIAINPRKTNYTTGQIFIDINGSFRKPNIAGKDYFIFNLELKNNKIITTSGNRDKLIEDCKLTGSSCAALIMKDNWQIKDDYPW